VASKQTNSCIELKAETGEGKGNTKVRLPCRRTIEIENDLLAALLRRPARYGDRLEAANLPFQALSQFLSEVSSIVEKKLEDNRYFRSTQSSVDQWTYPILIQDCSQ
jgi:hypothetical protein